MLFTHFFLMEEKKSWFVSPVSRENFGDERTFFCP